MAGIIVDIDGTLLSGNNGIDNTIVWVNEKSKKYKIYISTGRPESERSSTTKALRNAGVKFNRLYMNSLGDGHKFTLESKKNHAEKLLKADNIVLAIDNDADARSVYSNLGIATKNPSSLPKTISKIEGFWEGLF
jgi:hydroxymethylpyrimidine pyrophosphatase-like HAD family hydrolase